MAESTLYDLYLYTADCRLEDVACTSVIRATSQGNFRVGLEAAECIFTTEYEAFTNYVMLRGCQHA